LRSRQTIVSLMFLLSGATGLLYEVAFAKVLATIFGATAYAISTVLSAFMAGLALGAYLGGRLASRVKRPLAAYGVAELMVGVICATTPWVFAGLGEAYVALARASSSLAWVTALRGSLTFTAILIPTACMGATLPLLSKIVAAGGQGGARLPRLYAINTIGGALGSLLSAYLVLPALGISGTMRAAAVVNVAIGLGAIALGRKVERASPYTDSVSPSEGAPKSQKDGPIPADFFVYAFASGFLVFATEVVETHLLTLLIGNSAYAFGLMLAVFLVCLGIGAARAPAIAGRSGSDVGLARGLALSALFLALTIPLWDQLPRFFSAAGKVVHSWGGREICRALAAFAILAIPTAFMGTTFPLLLGRIAQRASVARDVGKLAVANTLGIIFGSILTGYVVLPLLGSQRTLVAVAIGFAALALVATRNLPRAERSTRIVVALAGLAVFIGVLGPRWDLARLTNGANVYFTHGPPPDDILFVREDVHGGVTTVVKRAGLLTLYTNGKFQGDDGAEMAAQRRFAHFPSLFLKQEKRALVIGLGTGTTLGTVTAYPFEHIDVAEISPAIVEAAGAHFSGPNRHSLGDPRVELHLNDGRNVLLVGTEPYDLITIELTSVWFAGASNLYSTEFYRLAKSRLAPGGVLQQWVQLHHIRPRELAVIVRTLQAEFAHVALFEGGAQGILVASEQPLMASRATLAERDAIPAIRETLDDRSLESLFDELLLSDDDLERLTRDVAAANDGPIISRDDNLFLEYATPKGNVLNYDASLAESMAMLRRYHPPDVRAKHLGE